MKYLLVCLGSLSYWNAELLLALSRCFLAKDFKLVFNVNPSDHSIKVCFPTPCQVNPPPTFMLPLVLLCL